MQCSLCVYMCVRVLCVCVCAYVWSQIEKEASWVDDAYSSDLYLTAIRVHSMWVASKKEVEPRLPAYALKNKTLWVMLFSSKISLVLQVNPSNQGHLTYVSLCVFCFVACLASLAIKFYLSWKAANLSVCTERFPFPFPFCPYNAALWQRLLLGLACQWWDEACRISRRLGQSTHMLV